MPRILAGRSPCQPAWAAKMNRCACCGPRTAARVQAADAAANVFGLCRSVTCDDRARANGRPAAAALDFPARLASATARPSSATLGAVSAGGGRWAVHRTPNQAYT